VRDHQAQIVPHLAHTLEGLSVWIADRPVLHAQAEDVRALVSTAHRDHQRRPAHHLGREEPRARGGQVHSDFLHGRDHFGVKALGGLDARRERGGPGRVGQEVEEGGRHLRAAGIARAGEHHRVP
jgi:hypothetical protein